MADHRQPLQALYTAPLATFVAERKRLAAALRAAGDDEAAKALAQRRRPPASAWAVNQLYWHERGAFDALLAAAGRMRKGDLSETSAYREALGALRELAAAVLRDAGHAATAATLSRVTGTLAALAAAGGFDPDPPGALTADREPPGFDAFDQTAATARPARTGGSRGQHAAAAPTAASDRARLAAARAREEADRKARQGERHRLETALKRANAEVRRRERTLSLLQHEVRAAETAMEKARDVVRDLERKLQRLDAGA